MGLAGEAVVACVAVFTDGFHGHNLSLKWPLLLDAVDVLNTSHRKAPWPRLGSVGFLKCRFWTLALDFGAATGCCCCSAGTDSTASFGHHVSFIHSCYTCSRSMFGTLSDCCIHKSST
jgi:hypothetical protein